MCFYVYTGTLERFEINNKSNVEKATKEYEGTEGTGIFGFFSRLSTTETIARSWG